MTPLLDNYSNLLAAALFVVANYFEGGVDALGGGGGRLPPAAARVDADLFPEALRVHRVLEYLGDLKRKRKETPSVLGRTGSRHREAVPTDCVRGLAQLPPQLQVRAAALPSADLLGGHGGREVDPRVGVGERHRGRQQRHRQPQEQLHLPRPLFPDAFRAAP